MIRALTVALAGLLAAVALKRMMAALSQVQAPATVKAKDATPVRLRQDPVTGVYYPEH